MVEGAGLSSYAKTLDGGDFLFREGDRTAELFVIRSGLVHLLKEVDGHEYLVGEAGPGDFVGEVGGMAGMPQPVGAKAIEATECWALDATTLENLVVADRELTARLLISMAQRVGEVQRMLAVYASRDPFFRVCQALIHGIESNPLAQAEGPLLRERLRDVGTRLKLRPSETAEVSKLLMRHKLIRVHRDGVLVPDVEKLRRFLDERQGEGGTAG